MILKNTRVDFVKFLKRSYVSDGNKIMVSQQELQKAWNQFDSEGDGQGLWEYLAKKKIVHEIALKNVTMPDEAGTEVNGYRIELMDIPF